MNRLTFCLALFGISLVWLCSVISAGVIPLAKEDAGELQIAKQDDLDPPVVKFDQGKEIEKHDQEKLSDEKGGEDDGGGGAGEGDDKEGDDDEKDEEKEEGDEEGEGKEEGEEEEEEEESSLYESMDPEKERDGKLRFEAEPPKHWDGVRLERNGNINGDIEQELFLGPDHDEFESIPEEVGKEKLMEVFKLVDLDGDARLTMDELIEWITLKTKEHFQEAVQSSKTVFPKVDTDGDGKLTWDEYTLQFLKQRGYSKKKIEKFKEGKQVLQEHDEEDNAIYRDRWETADENEDNALDSEEFISFMHPEHSERMLNIVVDEILHELDQNGDKRLTLTEFVSVPISREEDLAKMEKEDEWIRGRKEEFETRIDVNHDGVADLHELKAYMDPRNKQHAESEARHLMGVADDNQDGMLSPQEVLGNYFVFIGSKVYNYARNVHDEF
ncbi:45 kDa calcium-binding protein [Holothuria leucospilota]|uniref:45 kDa calcium-binding protein n=1 Tax=Holothuria leucospilota TaxID=206669 RepID=A0A9Q0YEJ5_HOLLE|nr:45 kDa calcium-binding protein [Holothuria leucospilota]